MNRRSNQLLSRTTPCQWTPFAPPARHYGVTNLPTDIPKNQVPMLLHRSTNAPSNTIPGPGHIPDQPHPTPKITLPTINFQSISWVLGRLNSVPNSGLPVLVIA